MLLIGRGIGAILLIKHKERPSATKTVILALVGLLKNVIALSLSDGEAFDRGRGHLTGGAFDRI